MKLSEINLRDPFILNDGDTYYLYGTRVGGTPGFDVYKSFDLEEWTQPKPVFEMKNTFWATEDFWAPEVHFYQGRYYMFATFKSEQKKRGTQILVSDAPDEVFEEHSEGPLTPEEWECLDGTLYVDAQGIPYMIFCHEWLQIHNGAMCAVQLSEDLKNTVGEPWVLWHAKDAKWSMDIPGGYVTDGPYLYKKGKDLLCFWSSFDSDGYVVASARSDNGDIRGKWIHDRKLFFSKDGGHGMFFWTIEGKMKFVCHAPNIPHLEHPVLYNVSEIMEKDGVHLYCVNNLDY